MPDSGVGTFLFSAGISSQFSSISITDEDSSSESLLISLASLSNWLTDEADELLDSALVSSDDMHDEVTKSLNISRLDEIWLRLVAASLEELELPSVEQALSKDLRFWAFLLLLLMGAGEPAAEEQQEEEREEGVKEAGVEASSDKSAADETELQLNECEEHSLWLLLLLLLLCLSGVLLGFVISPVSRLAAEAATAVLLVSSISVSCLISSSLIKEALT